MLDAYQQIRRSVTGEHPIGLRDVVDWLDLQGVDDQDIRQRAFTVLRKVDNWQMQRWYDERKQPKGNKGDG